METQTEVLRSFETEEEVALELKLPSGRMEIEAGPGDVTRVELSPLDDKSSTVRAIEEATIELRSKLGTPRLHVEVSGRRFGSSGNVLMRIRCREGSDVHAKAAAAEVRATGRLGVVKGHTASGEIALDRVAELDLHSASGDIRVETVDGRASVDTASGDVSFGSVRGGGRFRSASGSLHVGEASGSFAIKSASGDHVIESIDKGDVNVRSASGDVTLGIARGSTVSVDARSASGRMTSEIDLGETPSGPAGDAPHVDVSVVGASGDVRIKRA